MKLNTRKLYMADGYAVKELLKITSVLHEANMEATNDDDDLTSIPLDISSKVNQLKACRLLASDITEKGATLHDLLGKEIELRDIRASVISRPFDLKAIGAAVNEAIKLMQNQIISTNATLENLAADESNLVAKIDKKKVELDRAEKRLKSLQGVRPAYMDEYEKIELELASLYEIYMERFRNLTFLEQQHEEYNRLEQNKFEVRILWLPPFPYGQKQFIGRRARESGQSQRNFDVAGNGDHAQKNAKQAARRGTADAPRRQRNSRHRSRWIYGNWNGKKQKAKG
ncbi:Clusterin-associated protein 1 [Quaeritorhiza haematococci]|nr:Clusterin-associated protein 1 [Quaeritorhiza haematococci]